MFRAYLLLIHLVLVCPCWGQGGYLDDYQLSCYGARQIHKETVAFCPMVDWQSGTLYNSSTFSVYDPGPALDLDGQSDVARSLFRRLLATASGKVDKTCESAVQRFACVASFPYCQSVGESVSSISYLPPCKVQCEQVLRTCQPSIFSSASAVNVDCSSYSLTQGCSVYVPRGRFLLYPDEVGARTCATMLVLHTNAMVCVRDRAHTKVYRHCT
jgi:hypothetical protein